MSFIAIDFDFNCNKQSQEMQSVTIIEKTVSILLTMIAMLMKFRTIVRNPVVSVPV